MKSRIGINSRSYGVASTWGEWLISLSDRGIRSIGLPAVPPCADFPPLHWTVSDSIRVPHRVLLRACMRQIRMYTRGEAEYLDVETDIRGASVFQERVWSAMRDIPCGARMSYGEIARNLGAAGAYRAVGNACAANPLPLVFPCHRVVGVRTLGGFSSGLSWKVFLLNMEKKHAEKGISLTGDEKKGKIAQGAE